MLTIITKSKNTLLTCFTCLLLSGCSLSFIYNNLDWWVNWYLDDYVVLNDQQQEAFDKAFDELHVWHRKNELKQYYRELTLLKTNVNNGITDDQIAMHLENVKGFWANFRHKAQPDLVQLTYSLDNEQRRELLDALEERNREIKEERAEISREEWVKKECVSTQKEFREWLGKLTKAQKAMICEQVQGYQSSFHHWMQYRENWRTNFAKALSPENTKELYEQLFVELIINPEQLRGEEHQRLIDENNAVFRGIFVEIMNNLTNKQQNRFNNRIDDLIEDLTALEAKD